MVLMKSILCTFCICMMAINCLSAQNIDLPKADAALCEIHKKDQSIRSELIEVMKTNPQNMLRMKARMDSIDRANQNYVSNFLDNYGWPESLSQQANNAIFLVIDHADNNFSKKYFPMVSAKCESGLIPKAQVVTLEDRILMRSTKKQKYGTQTISKLIDGKNVVYVWPIENVENVDQLRSSVGLPSMQSYIQMVENMTGQKVVFDKTISIEDLNVSF